MIYTCTRIFFLITYHKTKLFSEPVNIKVTFLYQNKWSFKKEKADIAINNMIKNEKIQQCSSMAANIQNISWMRGIYYRTQAMVRPFSHRCTDSFTLIIWWDGYPIHIVGDNKSTSLLTFAKKKTIFSYNYSQFSWDFWLIW